MTNLQSAMVPYPGTGSTTKNVPKTSLDVWRELSLAEQKKIFLQSIEDIYCRVKNQTSVNHIFITGWESLLTDTNFLGRISSSAKQELIATLEKFVQGKDLTIDLNIRVVSGPFLTEQLKQKIIKLQVITKI